MSTSVAILCIGDELLNGAVADKNVQTFALALDAVGGRIAEVSLVGDAIEEILAALQRLTAVHRLVVCTGGLGPTSDDRTAEAVAKVAGVPLQLHEESWTRIQQIFQAMRLDLPPSNIKQAMIPQGATVVANPAGTAPGFRIPLGDSVISVFPGVPREVVAMIPDWLDGFAAPWLDRHPPLRTSMRVFGPTESQLGEMLTPLERQFADVRFHYRAQFPEILVELDILLPSGAEAQAVEQAEARLAECRKAVGQVVGDSYGDRDRRLPVVVTDLCRSRKATLALAESCTGGLAAKLVTDAAGVSDVFIEGFVTYANTAKVSALGVDGELLDRHGAVSRPVCVAMARGALLRSGASVAAALTGIAGPTGGSAERPIGTVWIAVAVDRGALAAKADDGQKEIRRGGVVFGHVSSAMDSPKTEIEVYVRRYRFRGDRERVRMLSAYTALSNIRKMLLGRVSESDSTPVDE